MTIEHFAMSTNLLIGKLKEIHQHWVNLVLKCIWTVKCVFSQSMETKPILSSITGKLPLGKFSNLTETRTKLIWFILVNQFNYCVTRAASIDDRSFVLHMWLLYTWLDMACIIMLLVLTDCQCYPIVAKISGDLAIGW